MSFMMHRDFEKGSENQHIQSTLLVGSEGVIDYSVHALNNVDIILDDTLCNSGLYRANRSSV